MEEEEITVVHMDLSKIDRERLESIANEALSVLTMGEVLAILADHNVFVQPRVVEERMN